MRGNALARRTVIDASRSSCLPDDLLHELQVALASLADVEVSYEKDREWIEQWLGSEAAKARLHAERECRHDREREPYVRRIDNLQRRRRAQLTTDL
jgi:hypothetical protein